MSRYESKLLYVSIRVVCTVLSRYEYMYRKYFILIKTFYFALFTFYERESCEFLVKKTRTMYEMYCKVFLHAHSPTHTRPYIRCSFCSKTEARYRRSVKFVCETFFSIPISSFNNNSRYTVVHTRKKKKKKKPHSHVLTIRTTVR